MMRIGLAGFVIWLGATIMLRVAGQWVIYPGTARDVVILLTVSGALMYGLPRALFSRLRVAPVDYPMAAIVLVAPGMILDTISVIWFARVFPNIAPESAGLFGGWLLFCNVIALVSAASARRAARPA